MSCLSLCCCTTMLSSFWVFWFGLQISNHWGLKYCLAVWSMRFLRGANMGTEHFNNNLLLRRSLDDIIELFVGEFVIKRNPSGVFFVKHFGPSRNNKRKINISKNQPVEKWNHNIFTKSLFCVANAWVDVLWNCLISISMKST